MNALEILLKYRTEFVLGLKTTLNLCLIIWFAGIIIGSVLGATGARWKIAVGLPTKAISFVLGGVPVLVFLFWMHYPLQSYMHVVVDPFYTAAATLSIVNILLVAELIRGAVLDFPSQYVASAKVCGLSTAAIIRHIQLPILLRQVLPGLLVIQITMLQSTLFASLISVDEIFRIAQRINSQIYRPVEIYTALALLFLAVCLPMHGLAYWLRVRLTRNLSER
jgi:ABC-type amino acid transport system permease subunit